MSQIGAQQRVAAAPVWDRPIAQRIDALAEVRGLRREWTAEWLRANPRAAGL